MTPSRLFDFLYYQQEHHPLQQSFGYQHNGQWTYFSTADMIRMVNETSLGLLTKLGVKPGDKIGLVSTHNRPEWVVLDIAMQQIGAIGVPVYPTISQREYAYIFNEAEVRYCFCGGEDPLAQVLSAQENIPSLEKVYALDPGQNAPCWEEIRTQGDLAPVEAIKNNIQASELATIIYTSGTTGEPKGVMLSHQNVVSNLMAMAALAPVKPGDRVLSFLPLCHIFERVATFFYIYLGVSIVQTGTDNLGGESGDLRTIRPHFFTTVPRLLEKVYDKIYGKGLELSGIKRFLFFWALRLAGTYQLATPMNPWQRFKFGLAHRLVFSKWREALGGNVKGIFTAAAACPEKIARVFCAAGIPIREGYGLSEASPGLTVNRFEEVGAMFGTVGYAIEGVKLHIDDSEGTYEPGEGEIRATGPNVMMGYYKKPAETAAVIREIDGERWLFTGDVGKMVKGPGGHLFLKITDRKKELLKTSGGKYVAPTPIESKFREHFLIEQIMVIGEQRKFVSALIVPSSEALRDWCTRHDLAFNSLTEAIRLPEVIARYQQILDKYNPLFNHIDQIKKFRLLDAVWEPVKPDGSEGELTPTMKLKRRVIQTRYARLIEEMYAEG
ncbi:MAG: hypothetical protein RI973_1694 [Bacteroidota bacterium]|jgi:long-chain acyl-CoA synthetase